MKSSFQVYYAIFLMFFMIYSSNALISEDTALDQHIESQDVTPIDFFENYQNSLTRLPFKDWLKIYPRKYNDHHEYLFRQHVYSNSLQKIVMHNKLFENGESTYFLQINQFSDLTSDQFANNYLGTLKNYEIHNIKINTTACKGSIMDSPNPKDSVDWVTKVTKAVDQGKCGSNWAIVAVSAVESLYAIKMGVLTDLSIQQLLQCSGDYGNEGCNGGFMDQAFWYMIDYGIATNKSYPNTSTVGKCRYISNMKYTGFSRCGKVPSGNYTKLISAVMQQPVSVSLNFDKQKMKNYGGGVFTDDCTNELNHGMLLTGYGGGGNVTAYWKLQNSFGKSWGTDGYFLLQRDIDQDGAGKCGVQLMASVPQNLG